MPIPTPELLVQLGPAIFPFERTQFSRKILTGEDIIFDTYNATEDGLPPNVIIEEADRIQKECPTESKYLWIIKQDGLYIIHELTPNPRASRKVVCHTNITGGGLALQGGELWFGSDGKVYINNRSGRYGATTLLQRQAILDYFMFVGYKEVIQLKPI